MAKKITKTSKTKTPKKKTPSQKTIEPYEHKGKQRLNNPPVGLVNADSEPEEPRTTSAHDSDLDSSPQTLGKAEQTSKQIAKAEARQETTTNSLNEFWDKFRLSPIEAEHIVLTKIGWMTLITLGPLGLRILLSTTYELISVRTTHQNITGALALSELQDSAFTYFSLSLFFGALIFCFSWYPTIRAAFESLLENDVLRDKSGKRLTESEFQRFLEDYCRNLHSRKRYILPAVSILITSGVSFFITTAGGAYWDTTNLNNPLKLIAFLSDIPRWILAPVLWSYAVLMWLWILTVTTRAIIDLTPRFQINVQPLHSDRAGGLKRLGDLCSYVGLLIIVVITPLMVLTIQRTIISTKIPACGPEIQQFINGEADMSQDRLIDCYYYPAASVPGVSRALISDAMTEALNQGRTLRELATNIYSGAPGVYLRESVVTNFSIYYVMDFIFLAILVFVFYVVIKPLFDIHKSMVEYEQKREHETNSHISELFDEMTTLIRKNKLEEADKAKTNIKFLNDELSEIQKYPRWPISALPVLRSYLTSSFITALITYIITLLRLSVSAEAGGVLNELIKSIFGE